MVTTRTPDFVPIQDFIHPEELAQARRRQGSTTPECTHSDQYEYPKGPG